MPWFVIPTYTYQMYYLKTRAELLIRTLRITMQKVGENLGVSVKSESSDVIIGFLNDQITKSVSLLKTFYRLSSNYRPRLTDI